MTAAKRPALTSDERRRVEAARGLLAADEAGALAEWAAALKGSSVDREALHPFVLGSALVQMRDLVEIIDSLTGYGPTR